MKIARPSKPEAPFKRKRSPPPQATKLLRSSLLAGVVFMILLAIVFLPRMFPTQLPVATPVVMQPIRDVPTNETRLLVTSVGAVVELSKLNATLWRNNTRLATLGPPLQGGNATFSFMDANNDGLLGPGDYFLLHSEPSALQRVAVYQLEAGSTFLVGVQEWTGQPT